MRAACACRVPIRLCFFQFLNLNQFYVLCLRYLYVANLNNYAIQVVCSMCLYLCTLIINTQLR